MWAVTRGDYLPKTERNREIAERYRAGDTTLEKLAAEYGVTRERIRQIVVRAGVKPPATQRRGTSLPKRLRSSETATSAVPKKKPVARRPVDPPPTKKLFKFPVTLVVETVSDEAAAIVRDSLLGVSLPLGLSVVEGEAFISARRFRN